MTPLPPGWPGEVPHPSHDAFVDRAIRWLLDNAPSLVRDEETLRRTPLALLHLVEAQIDAQVEGTRAAYASLRRELPLDAASTEASLAAIGRVGVRLQALRREVGLIGAALRDRVDAGGVP